VGELEARVTSLGPINPLALEELHALEERYRELDEQVSDVRNARRELQEVLRALDEEIMTTFSSAVADVNEHFSTLVSMLFPADRGASFSPNPTTHSTPASRSRFAPWAATSGGSHCSRVARGPWPHSPSSLRCFVRGLRLLHDG